MIWLNALQVVAETKYELITVKRVKGQDMVHIYICHVSVFITCDLFDMLY